MKYIKKTLVGLLTVIIILFSTFSLYMAYNIVDIKLDYKYHIHDEKIINLSLSSNFNSSINYLDYENMDEYKKKLEEELNDYEKIKELNYIENFNIDALYLFTNDTEAILNGIDDFDTKDLIDGKSYTNEEIQNKSFVGIFSEQFTSEHSLKVGDRYTLNHPMYSLTPVEIEVIGIYNDSNLNLHINNDIHTGVIYMPLNSVIEISNDWLLEVTQDHADEIVDFVPVPSLGSLPFKVNSEAEYLKLCDFLEESFDNKYELHRGHDFDVPMDVDTSEYEQALIFSLIIIFILWNVLNCIKKITAINFDKSKKKFEKELMNEKEKNVQDVFQMNQETHQLKHDMKHFLIQLFSLIENDEKDKSLEFIKEYYEDIEALEIPVYTQNNTLDLLINHYSKKAKKMDIDFTYSGNMVSDLKVNDRKLFILLSNALDNAFNHCNDNKTINLSLTYVEPYHRFTIVNSFDKKTEQNEDREHGHGLNSMKKLVEEMKGEIIFEENENKFICTILLP